MDEKKELINYAVSIEWEMFSSVNEGESPVSCQEDRVTFEEMRIAQFNAWSPDTIASYLDDLETAHKNGQNLIEAKYIHMMKTTQPAQYAALIKRVVPPSDEALALAKNVSDILLEQTRILFEDYPFVSGRGRPLYSMLDNIDISVETYQMSELMTYSAKTLSSLYDHIIALKDEGKSLAYMILENTVSYYGYKSLDEAEAVLRERSESRGAPFTFGCCAGGSCDV